MEQLHKRMKWQTVWNVVAEYALKKLPAKAVCQWLSISRVQLYRLKKRWERWQDKPPTADWLYQRPQRIGGQWPAEVKNYLRSELDYVKTQSPFFKGHFNFSFLAQRVHQKLGVKLSRQTIRRYAIKEGYFNPAVDTAAKAYVRFETGGIGMLFQHDSSIHAWVPYAQRHDVLIATIDDHSRKIVGALLVPKDTAWHHLCVVRQTVESFGCPIAYYLDNHVIFKPEKDAATQFTRALKAVEIEAKFTRVRHPQSKGKIEKHFDYLQRRLPFLCERYKAKNLTQANKILRNEIIPYYNEEHIHSEIEETPEKRWQRAIKEGRSFLKPIPEKTPMDHHFALHYTRNVGGDGIFTFHGMEFLVEKGPRYKDALLVLQPPYGPRQIYTRLSVLYNGSTLKQFILKGNRIIEEWNVI